MSKTLVDDRTYAELEAAVLAGETVTVEQMSAARERDRLAELKRQAEELRAARDEEEAHAADVEQLRHDIEDLPDNAAQLRRLTEDATRLLIAVIQTAEARSETMSELARRAVALGISASSGTARPSKHEVGWTPQRRLSGAPELRVGSRRLRPANPYTLIDRILIDARRATGLKAVEPGVTNRTEPRSIGEQLDSLDHTPGPRPDPVPIRWTQGSKVGEVELVAPQHAEHWVRRGMATSIDVA